VLVDLFECFELYLRRLKLFTEIPSAVEEILAKIMAELLGVLALATQQIQQGRFSEFLFEDTSPSAQYGSEKFVKKLLGEKKIEAVLQRLERLTVEESHMTVAQTMETVHCLFTNMKAVMDGMKFLPNRSLVLC
jgi:hypothetical protein